MQAQKLASIAGCPIANLPALYILARKKARAGPLEVSGGAGGLQSPAAAVDAQRVNNTGASDKGPSRAVVLSGGGARGAYEVGVLGYILKNLPKGVVRPGSLQIFCGTSVGAVHACFLASSAQLPEHNVQHLEKTWMALRIEQLVRMGALDLMRLPKDFWGLVSGQEIPMGMLLDIPAFRQLVAGEIPWPQIGRNIASGLIQNLTVSTTHIESGRTVVFVDGAEEELRSWTRDNRRLARVGRIGPQHAIASAAIPLLFPAVSIDGAYYCDGGLRQNTPLSPALRLGADRVLVVAVGHGADHGKGAAKLAMEGLMRAHRPENPPAASLVMGKVLNALLLDHLDYDLAQLRGINRILEDGEAAFGPTFRQTLSDTTAKFRGAGYRPVEPLVIRPSQDLGQMAWAWMQEEGMGMPGLIGRALSMVVRSERASSADFLSYLLFDGRYGRHLMELGRADAHAARDSLIAFFTD